MSSGRPDYNQKVVPIPEMIGDDETPYNYFLHVGVSAGSLDTVYTYTVPAGYDLYITLVIFCCEQPGTVAGDVEIDDVEAFASYFDTELVMNFTSVGYLKLTTGQKLDVEFYNGLPDDSMFALTLRGYLKET